MGRSYCEHGYPEEEDNLNRPLCPMCRALAEVYGDRREQRRYEIARDVMAATRAASWLSTRQTPDQSEVLASWALADADALLAALEETER